MGPPEPPQTKDEPAKTEIMCSKLKRKQLIFNQETDVKHHLRNIIKIPVVKLQRIDVQQRHVCKEESEIEMQVFKQNRTSHLDQAEPEPAQVKKEPEESENMCSDQKGEQLVLNQEPDMKEDMMNGSSNQNKVPILDQTKPESPQIKEELDEQCISREGESLLLIQETDVKVEFHSYCDETHKIYKKLKLESSDLLDQHHHLGNILKIPVVKLQRADVQQQHVCEERKQGRTSSLEQAEPELPQLKEEPDDLYYNHEGERLLLNQETDVMTHQHQLRNIQLQTIGVWDKWQLCNQERNLCLDQPEPEPPRVNEEPEKLCSDLEEEQLLQNQEFKSKCEETCKIFENFTFEFKELLKHQHHLKDMIKIPVVKLQRIDDQQQHVCEEDRDEWQLYKQKRNSSPDQPELPQIKEEPEETNIMCNNQEREQLVLNKEADMTMENPSECEETFKGWDIKEPLDHQYCLRTSETESHKIDVQQQHVCTEEDDDEWQFYKQERHSSRDQEEPELPQNKKLPEKLPCNQEGDQLLLNLKEAEMKMDSQSKCEETSEDCETNEMLDHQYCQRIRIPETKSHTTGVWDRWQLCNQERNLCLDQAEPPRVKEEPEKLCSDLEGEQLLQNQEFKSKCEEKCKIFENFKFEFKELLKHQHLLKDMIRIPVVKLQRIDDQQQHVCEEDRDEWQLYKQKRNSSPDQPELPQIKEEPEETNIMCNNQEREQLVLNKEADMTMENPSECEETFKGWDIKEPLDHQYCLRTSETESHKIDVQQQHVCTEEDDDEWQFYKQERHSSRDQEEPELPQNKKLPEKLPCNQEGDQLLLNLKEAEMKMDSQSKCEETSEDCETNEMLDHQYCQRIRIPETKSHTTGVWDKWQLCNQERNLCLDQAEPEPPRVKEEPEKLCSDLEEEQLLQNQEFKSKCEEKCKIFENFKFEFKELLKHQHLLKDMIRIPVVKLQRIDDQQQHVCEEDGDDWQLYKQKRNSSPDQPELPQIKEEPEETNIMCNNQEREQLVLNKEADMTTENPSECEETFKGWDIKEPLDHQYCLRTSETESHKIGM
ncbi:interaptin isoform X2 [Oryzias melastigma]|uniref:interaptin isoform X2 n=1 Tax=Oryzias melastigma TaxID=30732 RepID=UPI00168CAF21|nr:interaptin isoform X2 [Oryzias melastigma]